MSAGGGRVSSYTITPTRPSTSLLLRATPIPSLTSSSHHHPPTPRTTAGDGRVHFSPLRFALGCGRRRWRPLKPEDTQNGRDTWARSQWWSVRATTTAPSHGWTRPSKLMVVSGTGETRPRRSSRWLEQRHGGQPERPSKSRTCAVFSAFGPA